MTDKLLVPIDLDQEDAMDLIFPTAIEMARQRDADIRLLTVLPDVTVGMYPYVPHSTMDDARDQAQKRLEEVGQARLPSYINWEAEATVGPAAQTIVLDADDIGADMIIMASHDPKVLDFVLGSVADRVIRRAHCSVLVLRDRKSGKKS